MIENKIKNKEMTSRERVKMAIEHKTPDRIPIDLGGTNASIMKNKYKELLKYLGLKDDEDTEYTIWNTPKNISESLLRYLNVDLRRVWLGEPFKGKNRSLYNGELIDIYGNRYRLVGSYYETIHPVLNGAEYNDVLAYKFPDVDDPGWIYDIFERAEKLYNDTFAVSLPGIGGIFESGTFNFGFEDFLMRLVLDERTVNLFLDKVTDFMVGIYEHVLKEIGNYIDIIELGDDVGTQNGLFISRELYIKFIKPRKLKIISTIKKYSKAKIFYHSCGSIIKIINDLIEIGIDILNPVQPTAFEMEASSLKKRFGDRISFHGGIDTQYYLPKASVDELTNEVKRVIYSYKPEGGYILAPSHNIQDDVPVKNILTMYEAAYSFGRY